MALFSAVLAACAPKSQHPASPNVPPPGAPGAPAAAGAFAIRGPEASPITFERMARYPEPGGHFPQAIAYSPDNKWITFVASDKQDDENALFVFERESKSVRVLLRGTDLLGRTGEYSREEELRRERERQRSKGITSYRWAKKTPLLVIPSSGDVFARRGDGTITRLTQTPEPEIDPQPCDSGEWVAFVRKGELFAVNVKSGKETALTKGAPAGVTRGLTDFNGQEEFDEHSGYFWSPKCDRIAYLEVDERAVEQIPILGYRDGRADFMMQRYPLTGAKNPIVRLAIVDLATHASRFVRLPDSDHEKYLGRFSWSPDGRALYVQTLSRDQKKRELLRIDGSTLGAKTLAVESSPTWVTFSDFHPLERSTKVLWTSSRSGFRHIEAIDTAGGSTPSAITSGDWDVQSIKGVDEESGKVFFTASKESPLELHLYASALAGDARLERLTREAGWHEVTMDDAAKAWVDVHSAADRPPRAAAHAGPGADVGELPCPLDADFASLGIATPQMVTVRGASGDVLYGELLPPRNVLPGERHPAVVMVYGGPRHQLVQNRWAAHLLWQHLADRGIAVFALDNRGTPSRGRAFETATFHRLGELELADQVAGVDFLASLPFVDAHRIGIYGHSYGGFMAGLAMLRAPDRFRVGVAGSPLADMRLYDSGYTERYMGTPAENPRGYEAADLAPMAGNLRGHLFILHATMDENVHFQNTAKLVDALTTAQKPFDLLVFPGERHGYRSYEARRYALERVVDYLVQHL